jgi:hypothetical protein
MRSGRQVPAALAVALVAALCGVAGVAHGQGARVLGVQFATDPADAAQGPRVVAVTPGSTAQRMGVRVGDRLVKIGRVELVPRPSDPPNAASPTERVRVAMAEVRDLVPVVVLRDGQLLTGVGSWREDFVPVPLNNGDDLMGALLQLSEGMVPVGGAGGGSAPGSGGVPVPSAGGTGSVPSSAMASVPGATSDRRVTLGSASQASFEPRTVSFAREGGGQGGVVIDGERYGVQR